MWPDTVCKRAPTFVDSGKFGDSPKHKVPHRIYRTPRYDEDTPGINRDLKVKGAEFLILSVEKG